MAAAAPAKKHMRGFGKTYGGKADFIWALSRFYMGAFPVLYGRFPGFIAANVTVADLNVIFGACSRQGSAPQSTPVCPPETIFDMGIFQFLHFLDALGVGTSREGLSPFISSFTI